VQFDPIWLMTSVSDVQGRPTSAPGPNRSAVFY
jgi:hypothetical protein